MDRSRLLSGLPPDQPDGFEQSTLA
ncbi:Protein of unknown function [Thermobacillus xylanilyticus]|uniref:Uncharacterized protein n=1 Tax=Thermobacillus xylanilyticus TaxID=76633 RepID=A0ABM8V3G2_THEXY|nr:Protein of unknown function [Thermobacillus xylanilyticus]